MTDQPRLRIVVHPPSADGGRRVRVNAAILGVAYGVADLLDFLRRVGLNPEEVPLNDPRITWRGGGPATWKSSAH
ncbi:hypothetical protein [Streptomyces sp. NPDC048248]|uniref:hypothetical protein n=1 Tax=Streptomyces sp. NPDC048248 TaxID=3365523 RepID=UPI00371E3C3A